MTAIPIHVEDNSATRTFLSQFGFGDEHLSQILDQGFISQADIDAAGVDGKSLRDIASSGGGEGDTKYKLSADEIGRTSHLTFNELWRKLPLPFRKNSSLSMVRKRKLPCVTETPLADAEKIVGTGGKYSSYRLIFIDLYRFSKRINDRIANGEKVGNDDPDFIALSRLLRRLMRSPKVLKALRGARRKSTAFLTSKRGRGIINNAVKSLRKRGEGSVDDGMIGKLIAKGVGLLDDSGIPLTIESLFLGNNGGGFYNPSTE